MTHLTLGTDISKDSLDAPLSPTGETRTVLPSPRQRQPREAGKPHRVALAAIVRKLIILADTLVRPDRIRDADDAGALR